MALTKRQQELLRTMVYVHNQQCEEPFLFVTTHLEPPSLVYPSPVGGIHVDADDSDLLVLEKEGLVTLSMNKQRMFRGKPTSKGVEAVLRNFSDTSSRPNDGSVSPSLPVIQAVKILRQQLERASEIERVHYDDPAIDRWTNTTEQILHAVWGKPGGEAHQNTSEFLHCLNLPFSPRRSTPPQQLQADHIERTRKRKALLEGFIDQLEVLAPPAAQTAFSQYSFHPEIERVSGELYRGGHYKQAAFEAYIKVIDEVKSQAGNPADQGGRLLDGDKLMNRVFGCDNQTPIIQFNDLANEAERDEQRGFMNLFKGIVGLRNSKAHSNRLFDDPRRAHEYLALASVLVRVMEIARVNPQP